MTEKLEPLTEEQIQNWAREQFQKANQFLAQEGVLFDSVDTEKSRYLPPLVAIWKIKALDSKVYWVLTGDLPTDFMLASVADDARSALKHFSMSWQIKAENLVQNNASNDESQTAYAKLLADRAERIYLLQERAELWK
ncbi:DUF4826 family protein [Alteromonas lipolytica]|uniref:DUF4826 domain-containing protein n=1 Tax=Alteromonas lipolytica TaxID=1856405 RepID=A0A1E8FG99_9ALTE|nr:DUF4826 family protein [Alteromonas lipolytica]OFI34972.1 DUF4826 domain-containing protein [Alteromonas lipolytica]GGF55525.1 DUF4826 domain-containing protein [Alteromonas lipolytica]